MAGGNGDASGRPEISFRSSCGEGEHSREESTRRQKGEEAELADLFPLPAQQPGPTCRGILSGERGTGSRRRNADSDSAVSLHTPRSRNSNQRA